MRSFKAVVLSSMLSIVVVLCLTGSAMAAITSAQSSVSVDPTAPNKVQVYSSYSQDPVDQTINVSNFIMPRWDSTCSQAGYLDYAGGAHPNGVIDGPDDASFNSNIFEHISDFTLNPINTPTCIGTVAYTNSESQVVVDAKPGYFNKPSFTPTDDDSTGDSISIDFDLNPKWLATSYYLSYFERVNTTDCSSPDFDDLLTAAETETVEVTTDLKQVHEVTVNITGLDVETDYCVAFRANNAAGNDDSQYWSYYTLGDPPEIGESSFSSAISGIQYDVDVTPNITTSDTILSIEYFLKDGVTCVEPIGGPSSHDVNYDDGGGLGLRGFNPINLADTLEGLSAGATYCVRAYAYSYYGEDNSAAYETVTTIDKTAATVDSTSITRSDDPGTPVDIHAKFNDRGAKIDTGNISAYAYDIFPLQAGEDCDETATHGGPSDVASGTGGFSGMDYDFELALDEFERGQEYCAIFQLDSAWGSSYNGTHYFAYWGGTAPDISATSASADHTSIEIASTIDAGYLSTGWGALSFALDGDETCSDAGHVNSPTYTGADPLSEGATPPSNVNFPLTGMIANADYCVKIVAENLMGSDESDWVAVSTGDEFDTTTPSAPTNLAASNVTQTSATLSWTASTDNVGVTRYDVIEGDLGLVGSTASPSKSVSLTCGQTRQFHVIAYDDAGNESDKSDTIDVTGAACDVPPPPPSGGGNAAPPAKQCVNPIKKKSVSGKSGKKKLKLEVSGKLAADGQSVVITAKSKAKVTFKVDGKKVTASKGSITVKSNPSLVTVSIKIGSKTKTIKLQTSVSAC